MYNILFGLYYIVIISIVHTNIFSTFSVVWKMSDFDSKKNVCSEIIIHKYNYYYPSFKNTSIIETNLYLNQSAKDSFFLLEQNLPLIIVNA